MRSRLALFVAALFLTSGSVLVGCDSSDTDAASGSFRVLLTDAPGDFVRAVVTIERVYLQGEGSEDESGRVTLRAEPVTVDLLTLQNEVMDLVEDATVPPGRYAQLRLQISGGFIEVEREGAATEVYASSDDYAAAQGVTADGRLQMPSFDASGLKITLPGGAAEVEGDQHVYLLDFNVAESFGRQAGNSGMWVLRPVIRATDFTLTGGADMALVLGPEVQLPGLLTLADFTATLDKDGDIIDVPFEDADGDATFTASFDYLAPGDYAVGLGGPAGIAVETSEALPLALTVESGRTVRDTLTITAITGG